MTEQTRHAVWFRRLLIVIAGGLLLLPVLLALLGAPAAAFGQYENIVLPCDTIEQLFRYEEYRIAQMRDTRFEGDRTQIVVLMFEGYMPLRVKWAAAPRGGDSFNNRPRFEVAVYELQKLFLDEEDFVVPPTVVRACMSSSGISTGYSHRRILPESIV